MSNTAARESSNVAAELLALQEYFEAWDALRDISEARKTADRSRFFTYVMPKFGRTRVDRIKSRDVQAWADSTEWAASRLGKTEIVEVGDATKYATLMVLRQVLELPLAKRLIRSNPAAGIKTTGNTNTIEAVDELTVLSPEDSDRLVAEVDPHYRTLVLLGIRLGLTWAEAMGLQVQDVDFPSHTLHVGRLLGVEIHGVVQVREGKVNEQRNLQMPADLEDALAGHIARTEPIRSTTEPWAFLTPTGKRPLRANWNRYTLRPALTRAGLNPSGITFHTFRHTAARDMLANGADPDQVRYALGHKDLQTTKRFYRQFLQDPVAV